MTEPVTVPLSKPIESLGRGSLDELQIREPIGADVIATGYPMRLGPTDTDIDAERMTALIARCGNITRLAAGGLVLRDWNAAMTALLGFWQSGAVRSANAVVLTVPVELAGGGGVTTLTLREPAGTDLAATGYPVRMGGEDSRIDAERMTKLIARLSGASYDAIVALPIGDWNACMGCVLGFLGDATPSG